MRLPNDARSRVFALGLTAALAGCGMIGGGKDRPAMVSDDSAMATASEGIGPSADYPMVLGDAFTVDGQRFVPADTASYDAVGYATIDRASGQGITAAHKTLPLPSYVEVTSLDTGRTILVRVERRGPMTASRLIALSPAAQSQLGGGEGSPVRVRRVNPPEAERAALRSGKAAPERMQTPKSLVTVLQRKLPAQGEVSLRSAAAEQARAEGFPAAAAQNELPPVNAASQVARAAAPAAAVPGPVAREFDQAFRQSTPAPPPQVATGTPRAVTSYPLAPLDGGPATRTPVRTAAVTATPARATPRSEAPAPVAADDGFVVQAAAFSSKSSADKAAGKIGGFVMQSGKYYRVRTGPYATRGQAEAALAKVRAAGYSEARVFTAG